MKNSILTAALTWKQALAVLVLLALGAALFLSGRSIYRAIQSRPKSASRVKAQIFSFLREKSGVKSFQTELPKDSAQEMGSMSNDLAALRADIATLQTKTVEVQGQIRTNIHQTNTLFLELRRLKRAAGILPRQPANKGQSEVATTGTNSVAQTNQAELPAPLPSPPAFDLVAASQTNESFKVILDKERELAVQQEKLATSQRAMQSVRTNLLSRNRAVAAKQRELAALQNGTAGVTKVTTVLQSKIKEAVSWEDLYKALGQQLWLADQLLSRTNLTMRQSGLQLADQVRAQASIQAENDWLAARICEAFIWPSLDLADAGNGSAASRDQLLISAGMVFRQAGETNNYIRNAEMLISKTSNPIRADYARYQLGFMLENMGNFEASLKQYRAIQSSNSLLYAAKRIPIVEEQLKARSKPR